MMCGMLPFASLALTLLLQTAPAAAQSGSDAPDAALFQAIEAGNLDGVRRSIEQGGHVNTPGEDGMTPLMRAAADGSIQIVQLLFDKGAAVDGADSEGITPLMLAASANRVAVVRALIARRANVNARA